MKESERARPWHLNFFVWYLASYGIMSLARDVIAPLYHPTPWEPVLIHLAFAAPLAAFFWYLYRRQPATATTA